MPAGDCFHKPFLRLAVSCVKDFSCFVQIHFLHLLIYWQLQIFIIGGRDACWSPRYIAKTGRIQYSVDVGVWGSSHFHKWHVSENWFVQRASGCPKLCSFHHFLCLNVSRMDGCLPLGICLWWCNFWGLPFGLITAACKKINCASWKLCTAAIWNLPNGSCKHNMYCEGGQRQHWQTGVLGEDLRLIEDSCHVMWDACNKTTVWHVRTGLYLPLNPNMDNPNSRIILSAMEIALLSHMSVCLLNSNLLYSKKFYLVLLFELSGRYLYLNCNKTQTEKWNMGCFTTTDDRCSHHLFLIWHFECNNNDLKTAYPPVIPENTSKMLLVLRSWVIWWQWVWWMQSAILN